MHTEQVVLRNTYVHTYMHILIINEKRGHEFQREHGGISGRFGKEEREEDNVYCTLKIKRNNENYI